MAGVSVTIGGNAAGANAAFDKVGDKARQVADRIAKGFQERVGHRLFDGLIRAANSLPAAMKAAIDAGGRLSDQVARTGAEGSKLVVLERALTNAGMAADVTTKLLNQMQRSIAGINEDNQSTAAGFALLGLSMEELRELDPVDALRKIGHAIAGIEDPAARTAVAMRIFGRAGTEALVLFSERGAFEQARQELGQLPQVLAANANEMDRVSDRLSNLGTAWQQVGAAASVAVLPALEKLTARISSMDLTGLGNAIGRVLNLVVDLSPALMAVGITMAGLKLTAFVSALVASTKAWLAEAAAIRANSAALAQNAGARGGAAGRGAMMGGPTGLAIAAGAVGFSVIQNEVAKANDRFATFEENVTRGNAALEKFHLGTMRGQVQTREEIEGTVGEIEKEIRVLRQLGEEQAEAVKNKKAAAQIRDNTEATVRVLELQAAGLRKTTEAQLAANQAKRAATEAAAEQAAKLEEVEERYQVLRAQLDKEMADKPFEVTGKGDELAQIKELEEVSERLREKLYTGDKAEDLEIVIKLRELEEKRVGLVEKLREKEEEVRASRRAAAADFQEEMGILSAQIQGQDAKVAALEREADIRKEIARLVSAGFTEEEARPGAERLVDARLAAEAAAEEADAEERRMEARRQGMDVAKDALAAFQGEGAMAARELEKRARDIASQSGLGIDEARGMAQNEADLERLMGMREGGQDGFQSTLGKVSDMARVGGGGAAVSSGLDIARQQTDLQRQMVQLLGEILQRAPEGGLSEY